jgi:SAM-dependent methyltransferase
MTATRTGDEPDLLQTSLALRGGLGPADPAYRGQAEYTPGFLTYVYDPLVLGFANRFVWRCPTDRIVDLYNHRVSSEHLDVGPGTGYLLDRCRFPTRDPAITLLDLNADVLSVAAHRIRRYEPRTYQANLLEPLDLPAESFGSIAMSHVLHCLPGGMEAKAAVLERLRLLLRTGGRLFGTTVFGTGVPHSRWSTVWLSGLNRRGVFDNRGDNPDDLRAALRRTFASYELHVRGRIGVFVGTA